LIGTDSGAGGGIGVGAGAALAATTPDEQVHIPAQTLLDFELDRPLSVAATPGVSQPGAMEARSGTD
jgi:hypothetical protein